ncbi:hypothetical protein Tco_0291020 [Tanacetum coccineum]
MSNANMSKLNFAVLDISGKDYLPWTLDPEIHLTANNLGETIKTGNKVSSQERAKAMIFLRHHLHEYLKKEYLTVKDPLELWEKLKEMFDHQKQVILPKARYDRMHLRLQDFKSVNEYNSAMFSITSKLILCGEKVTEEEMLEKTFSTFHASNMLLQQQYRERGFKKYHELISVLLVAEQNNELLMKNHQALPTGSTALPEANATSNVRGRGRGNNRENKRGRGRGRGRNIVWHRDGYNPKPHDFKGKNEQGKKTQHQAPNNSGNACHRCGMKNHWSKQCRTPKHFVDLYQASIKKKGKDIETNFIDTLDNNEPNPDVRFDSSDFFDDIEDVVASFSNNENDN